MVIDSETNEHIEYYAKVIFMNASTLGTSHILLNSVSDTFPDGLGNSSGHLGHNLMDHHFQVGASGTAEGFDDKYYYGRRPIGVYIPRYRNLGDKPERDYLRGFHYGGSASRTGWQRAIPEMGYGQEFNDEMTEPGPWVMGLGSLVSTYLNIRTVFFWIIQKRINGDNHCLPLTVSLARMNEKCVSI